MHQYRQLSETHLIYLLKTGDHLAFTEIYNRFFGILYVFVQKRIKDEDHAKDILQDLFSQLWIKRETLNFSGPLPAYLYKAVRNKMLDFIQKTDTQRKYINELELLDADPSSSDDLIREKQLTELIEKEVDRLPEQMKAAFLLSRKANMTYFEISRELKLSPLSVKTYAKNAIKKLRIKLGKEYF